MYLSGNLYSILFFFPILTEIWKKGLTFVELQWVARTFSD